MNELEGHLRQWRQRMNSEGQFHADEMDELENHLLESIDRLTERGLSGEEAFMVAVHRLGTHQTLGAAYDENRTLLDYVLRPPRSIATLMLIVALLATALVMWKAYTTVSMFGEADRMIVMARQGAEVRVASDGLYVTAGEAGMISRSIIPVLAVPFGMLSLLSVLGWIAVWHRSSSSRNVVAS